MMRVGFAVAALVERPHFLLFLDLDDRLVRILRGDQQKRLRWLVPPDLLDRDRR